jgi:lipopolysaccharide assembly outer membrane protein LptD (OstA)
MLNFAQQTNSVTIVGDSLVGKTINGEKIREVIGNVIIKSGNATINCDKSVQHLESSKIDLFGNVYFVQDTLTLTTSRAHYLSQQDSLILDTNFTIIVKSDSLRAERGTYSKKSNLARLFGNVHLKRDSLKLSSEKLLFYRKTNKIIATTNVKVFNSASILNSDSLIYFMEDKITLAFKDVSLYSEQESFMLFGNALVDSGKIKFTEVIGSPMLFKVDSLDNGEQDSLYVLSKKMTMKNDSGRIVTANGTVRILRRNLSIVADSSIFKIDSSRFTAVKTREYGEPVKLWYDKTQVTGDSVFVLLDNNTLRKVIIKKNAQLISVEDSLRFRYNQITGNSIVMDFAEGKLKSIFVDGNVLSIYYMVDNGVSNGLIKSSARSTLVEFDSNGVAKVKLFGTPKSEYHPENLIDGNEPDFLLPSFRLYQDKPKRSLFIDRIKRNKNFIF